MSILQLSISSFLLYLPAMIANMAPVVAAKYNLIPRLNRPLDLGMRLRGIRVLGSHKTIRGIVVAVFAGAITGGIEAAALHQKISFGFFIGAVLGFGAIAGDAIKSFFKRRLRVAPGSLWIPFDQIDFVIGATLAGIFFIPISIPIFIFSIFFIGCASYVVSYIGIALHFKKSL